MHSLHNIFLEELQIMKKTILATTLALGLGVTGITAGQDAEASSIDKAELAYTAQNNPEALNASALHEGQYDYNFDHKEFNYDFNSDGTNYAWAYQSNGNAQAEVPTQEQAAAPAVKEETQNVEQNNYTYTEEVQQPVQNTQTAAPSVQETQEVEQPSAPAPQSKSVSTSNTNSGLNWGSLASCESGGNASVVSSNGMYHGLYQFDAQTWQSVGGSGVASDASAAEQTQRAQMLYDERGSQPWPVCGTNL